MTTPVCPAPAVAPEQHPALEPMAPITLTTPQDVARWLRTLARRRSVDGRTSPTPAPWRLS
jgi:hypothetical protein